MTEQASSRSSSHRGSAKTPEQVVRAVLAAAAAAVVAVVVDNMIGAGVMAELVPRPVTIEGGRIPLIGLALVGFIGVVVAEVTWGAKNRARFIAVLVLGSGFLCASFYFMGRPLRLQSPALVTGRVSAPGQLVAYLFVRPVGQQTCWLQAPVPLLVSPDGRWQTDVFLGGAPGARFELWAVASGDTLQDFTVPDGYPCSSISRTAERDVRTVISR